MPPEKNVIILQIVLSLFPLDKSIKLNLQISITYRLGRLSTSRYLTNLWVVYKCMISKSNVKLYYVRSCFLLSFSKHCYVQ